MMYRRQLRNLVSSLAVLLLAGGSALAATFNVPFSGKMGEAQIAAGRYYITWEQHSPDVTVTVAKGKEVVATVKARIETRDAKFQRNMVVYDTNADGTRTITELRIGGTHTAIVFSE
jgi:hypothetical protein